MKVLDQNQLKNVANSFYVKDQNEIEMSHIITVFEKTLRMNGEESE